MSTSNSALQTLASRIFATAKGHAYDEGGSAAAIAIILETEGLTPAVLAAQAVTASSAAAAQTAAQQAADQLAATQLLLSSAQDKIAQHEAALEEHKTAIAERDARISSMQSLANEIIKK